MIRRGYIYRVRNVFRDPKASRPVLVMTANARNLDARSPTVVAVPLTTSLRGGSFRVRLARSVGGLTETSEAACEQIVQVAKTSFAVDEHGRVLPVGGVVEDPLLDAVVHAILNVISP